MASQGLDNEAGSHAVKEARSALRQNLGAGFADQAPHLRTVLGNLPILGPRAPALQARPMDKAERLNTEGVIGYLTADTWLQNTADATAGPVAISDETDLLVVTFAMHVYSYSYVEVQVTIARVGEDEFLCWRSTVGQGMGLGG